MVAPFAAVKVSNVLGVSLVRPDRQDRTRSGRKGKGRAEGTSYRKEVQPLGDMASADNAKNQATRQQVQHQIVQAEGGKEPRDPDDALVKIVRAGDPLKAKATRQDPPLLPAPVPA